MSRERLASAGSWPPKTERTGTLDLDAATAVLRDFGETRPHVAIDFAELARPRKIGGG